MSYRAKVDLIRANEEIAQLRAINAELVATLKQLERELYCIKYNRDHWPLLAEARDKARATIAKAEQVRS